MTWRKKWTLAIFAVVAAAWMAYWATAYADSQTLDLPVPTPTPTPIAFAYHYRCSMAKDGTTVTMKPIEGGIGTTFSCLNCKCLRGEK